MKRNIVNVIYWIAAIANSAIGWKVSETINDKVWEKTLEKTNNLPITLVVSVAASAVSGLSVFYALTLILVKMINAIANRR